MKRTTSIIVLSTLFTAQADVDGSDYVRSQIEKELSGAVQRSIAESGRSDIHASVSLIPVSPSELQAMGISQSDANDRALAEKEFVVEELKYPGIHRPWFRAGVPAATGAAAGLADNILSRRRRLASAVKADLGIEIDQARRLHSLKRPSYSASGTISERLFDNVRFYQYFLEHGLIGNENVRPLAAEKGLLIDRASNLPVILDPQARTTIKERVAFAMIKDAINAKINGVEILTPITEALEIKPIPAMAQSSEFRTFFIQVPADPDAYAYISTTPTDKVANSPGEQFIPDESSWRSATRELISKSPLLQSMISKFERSADLLIPNENFPSPHPLAMLESELKKVVDAQTEYLRMELSQKNALLVRLRAESRIMAREAPVVAVLDADNPSVLMERLAVYMEKQPNLMSDVGALARGRSPALAANVAKRKAPLVDLRGMKMIRYWGVGMLTGVITIGFIEFFIYEPPTMMEELPEEGQPLTSDGQSISLPFAKILAQWAIEKADRGREQNNLFSPDKPIVVPVYVPTRYIEEAAEARR